MMDNDLRLDGNAVAGLLADLFGREMTGAIITCAGCGATGPVGRVMIYRHGMGTVVRCAVCETVLFRLAQIREQTWLDLRGIATLRFATEVTVAEP